MENADRSEYPALLTKVQPGPAVDILNDRVRQIGRLNTNIADWLQERSRIEEQYAASLRKLARRNIENDDLGIFSVPWSTITNSMETLAESHTSLASKIAVDVERPLRDFASTNRDMQAMSTIQGNLASLAKDFEKAQQKTEKLQTRGDRAEANKVANAVSDLDNARAQWDSQAPYVFENLQALDETRVNQLRDFLTQLQTLEIDQVEKNRVAAEQCLNVLLNVETQDEIKTFALKAQSARPSESRSNRASFMPGMPVAATPTRGSSSNALSTIPSNPDDNASQASASTPDPSSSKKAGFKGLKRLGTVMSRRSGKQPASNLPTTEESPERRSRRPFGRLGRSKDSYGLEPPQEETSQRRPSSPLRMGSEVMEVPQDRREPTSPSSAPRLDPIPHINGTSSSARSPLSTMFPNGSHQGDLADLEPPKASQPEMPSVPILEERPRDSQGFSMPPPELDPISQAQADAAALGERPEPQYNVNIRSAPIAEEGGDAALASVATRLQAPPPTTARRAGTVRGRRDNRNSAVVSSYTPPAEQTEVGLPPAATPSTVERAFEPPPISTHTTAQEAQSSSAERAFSPLVQSSSGPFGSMNSGNVTAFSPFSASSADLQSPRPGSRSAILPDHTGDNHSIRSGRSTASQITRHPELQEPGLTSSIIETVSARIEGGKVASASLIGEIALAYNPADPSTAPGVETIRLENFSSLEKVAPNPAFINQTPDKEGEYAVNLSNIRQTQIAFKYQLRADDANSQTPLLIAPAFKIEPTQASVIINYSLNPGLSLQGRPSLNLSNVTIGLTLEGAKASQCLSKPQGTFNRERNLVYWHLGDITLTPGAGPEKLLARFTTDVEAKGGSIEGKWEIVSSKSNGHVGSALFVSMHGAGDGADPFADESGAAAGAMSWKAVPAVRKLVSGSYAAKS